MPFRTRTDGYVLLAIEETNEEAIQAKRLYGKLDWLGLVMIVVGTAPQVLSGYI
jgi:hypothetical protein